MLASKDQNVGSSMKVIELKRLNIDQIERSNSDTTISGPDEKC